MRLVGASGYADRPIGECSGGEQQRLLIAQALIRRPKLLLLDEPLDSLDLPNQAAVAALIARICRAENVSVLMVAHDVNPILAYLDQVVYIAEGRAAAGARAAAARALPRGAPAGDRLAVGAPRLSSRPVQARRAGGARGNGAAGGVVGSRGPPLVPGCLVAGFYHLARAPPPVAFDRA